MQEVMVINAASRSIREVSFFIGFVFYKSMGSGDLFYGEGGEVGRILNFFGGFWREKGASGYQ